jgi:predicted nucleic acid-binding protein
VSQPHFVDTNIFLRYLTQDPQRYKACLALFKQAEQNEVHLITSEAIIAETVFVLSSPKHYKHSRQQIQLALSRLLLLLGLKVPNRNLYLRALAFYTKNGLDFEDCLTIAYMEQSGVSQIYSYDRDFDAISGIHRIEPLQPEQGQQLEQENHADDSVSHTDD